MISFPINEKVTPNATRNGYAFLSLRKLLIKIVDDSDHDALRELHDYRTLFTFREARCLRLAEYVDMLRCASQHRYRGQTCLKAYDLTIDKFSQFSEVDREGIDCRKYFRAALKVSRKTNMDSEIQSDITMATVLQRLIYRHFLLSLREACRNGTMSRYTWKLPSGMITVLMPVTLTGRGRSDWLCEHVPDPNPKRAAETHRIQAIIDQHFHGSTFCSFQEDLLPEDALCSCDLPGYYEHSISVKGIAETLANEKAEDCFAEQRPAIQKLGSIKLKELIHCIVDGLSEGQYRDSQIAREFHLNKTTLSRFAGSKWQRQIPDLFANLARLLIQNPAYAEAIAEMGFKTRVFAIVGKRDSEGRQR